MHCANHNSVASTFTGTRQPMTPQYNVTQNAMQSSPAPSNYQPASMAQSPTRWVLKYCLRRGKAGQFHYIRYSRWSFEFGVNLHSCLSRTTFLTFHNWLCSQWVCAPAGSRQQVSPGKPRIQPIHSTESSPLYAIPPPTWLQSTATDAARWEFV